MNVGDLLHELRENILHDRSHRVAGGQDYLWSDPTLIRYINESQQRLARQALLLWDGITPEVTRIQLRDGVTEYPMASAVLSVVSARLSSSNVDLVRVGHSILNVGRTPAGDSIMSREAFSHLPPGRVVAYSTDETLAADAMGTLESPVLRVYPAPRGDALDYIQMRVIRAPLQDLTRCDLSAVPEVPTSFHLDMLDWAAYLALRIADVDAGMPRRAMEFQATFNNTVAQARRQVMRRLFAPQQWGFGRNGYSWEK